MAIALFTKLSGPDYVTISTTDPGSGQGLGVVSVAPRSSDVGNANVVVRVSDGVFWRDRAIPVVVTHELELNAQGNVSMVAGEVRYQPLAVDNPLEQNVQFYIASGPPFVSIDSPRTASGRAFLHDSDIGTWTVTVGVTNGTIRNEKSFTVEVLRNGGKPHARRGNGGPARGIVGRPVLFDGSRSSDPDGDRLIYSWRFGTGPRWPDRASSTATRSMGITPWTLRSVIPTDSPSSPRPLQPSPSTSPGRTSTEGVARSW